MSEEKAEEKVALVRTQTQVSAIGQDTTQAGKAGINYNLVKCIWIVLREQGDLWKWFMVLFIATLGGGMYNGVS